MKENETGDPSHPFRHREPIRGWPPSREGWPRGPWDNEPDRIEWEASGYPALIVRNHTGALCGYVGVPNGHPAYGKGYDEIPVYEVHGGLTYTDRCCGPICHVPKPGESDDVWWVGFDCQHGMDDAPGLMRYEMRGPARHYPRLGTYKTVDYVRAEVEKLALELRELESA